MDRVLFGNQLVRNTSEGIMLDEVSLNRIIKEHPTPFYIILKEKIRNNIQRIRKVAQSVFGKTRISYSVKANYMDMVLQEINEQNLPFELISQFEYDILQRNSLNRDNLIVGGPYLPDSLIENVLNEKNPLFVLYTIDQIRRLDQIAKKKKCYPNSLLRFIAPKTNGHLGFTPNNITFDKIKSTIQQCSNISFRGIHSHYGTQINSLETYRKNIRYLTEIIHKLEKNNFITADIFNVGGGLPNAGSLKEGQLYSMFQIVKEELTQSGYLNPSICLEPGRYIVEDAGLFLMEVIDVSQDAHSLFVNAGTYILPRFARNSLRFYNIDRPLSHYNHRTTIYGIVPSEEDILINNYNFSPKNEIGDKILVLNCGAYAFTFSTRFPYQVPPVISIDGSFYTKNDLHH